MNQSHLSAWIVTSVLLNTLLYAQSIAAQILPDATLPAGERSQVTGNPNVQIDGGARRGGNLFHSFSQFSVPTGGSAFFNNAADVQTIFSRVTGGSLSNIDGLIRANGTANLFLLNPNGILFGPNASLNIGGSFVGTTADAIGFPTGEMFSSDATQPLPSQLLTVNPNALFFNQLTPQPITVQAQLNQLTPRGAYAGLPTPVFTPSSFKATGLQVSTGQNLLLVGGPIQLDSGAISGSPATPGRPLLVFQSLGMEENIQPNGGWLISPGSYIELGAVGGGGVVGLSTTSQDWQLTIPKGVPRADISLSNGSGIYTTGAGGSIRLLAQNIGISRSVLLSGIASDMSLPNTQTGGLELDATGAITMDQSRLDSLLSGTGTTGSINLTAGDHISSATSYVINSVQSTGIGNTGNVNITTGSLFLTNSTQVSTETFGRGSAGSVNINVRGVASLGDSGVASGVGGRSLGNAGNINITAESLSLNEESNLTSYTFGQGSAGNININARDTVSLRKNATLSTSTLGSGNSGIININASNAISLDQGYVYTNIAQSSSKGNNGDTNLTTGTLSLTNGSRIFSFTLGPGTAGKVNINARDAVFIDGALQTPASVFPSSIITLVIAEFVGQGGAVNITTGSLALTNGGNIDASTNGQGDAGRVTIDARDSVEIRGTAPTRSDFRSGITTSATQRSLGNGGEVFIKTDSLAVSDQGRISTNAQGRGTAGDIQIEARGSVSFNGGDAISTLDPDAVGRGGNIKITARSLALLNGAQLSAATAGAGSAGNITVSADTVGLNNGGRLLTTTSSNGRAGDITVKTPDLQLAGATSGLFANTTSTGDAGNLTIQPLGNGQRVRVNLQDGAEISASTSNSGNGGQLTITAPDSITLTGDGSIVAAGTGGSGAGGNLNLRTGTLRIQNQAEVTVSSSGTGSAGSLLVDADRIFLNNQGRIRADTLGGGGNINVRSPLILLRNGSNISTNAKGENVPGGNIGIDTRFLIAVLSEDSNISANSEDFRGGNVRINAFSIFGIQPNPVSTPLSDITATGATTALPGTIDVTTAGIDPSIGLVQLPTDLADASGLIAQGCPADKGNSFVITGRGGLPPTPEQQLDDDAEWDDREILTVAQQINPERRARQLSSDTNPEASRPRVVPQTTTAPSIIEATGWQKTANGDVILVADTPDPMVQNALYQSVACHGRR
jgi:filamentous hemagglutinin family protein